MISAVQTRWFYIVLLLFIALNSALIANEFYYLPLLPAIIIVSLFAFISLDKLIYIIVFFTPLSLNVEIDNFAALNLPTEPLIFGAMLIFFFRLLYEGGFDRKVLLHPVTLAIIFHLIWLFITCFTSTMPFVSFKFFLARLWFVVVFYFLVSQLFIYKKNIHRFIWLFGITLAAVVVYSVFGLFQYGFQKQSLYWIMDPFFKDHTIYGAVLALVFPLYFAFAFDNTYSRTKRLYGLFLFTLLLLGIVLSYTRATWLSLFGAMGIYLLFLFKIRWHYVLLMAVGVLLIAFSFQTEIMMKLGKNKQSSSERIDEHLKSVSNIRSDASNMERINRWASAIRMFQDKPITGFGPGTYKFQYAPYQRSTETTYVSTNSGTMGNAHSEYLGPLSESGLPGMLSVIMLFLLTIYTASRVYINSKMAWVRRLGIASIIGLCTYYLHGFLNNFLDSDKAAVPFFAMTALLVSLDIYHKNTESQSVK